MHPLNLQTVSNAPQGSPEWWADRLSAKLAFDRPVMDLWWRYFVGDHPKPLFPDKINDRVWERYLPLLRRSRSNMMEAVVEASAERCRPIGFRLGSEFNHETDVDSWRIWQASNMDADVPMGIETSFAKGRAYLSVWKRQGDEFPTLAFEDPTQAIVENEPGSRHRRRAGMKTYIDEWTGQEHADILLPGELWRVRRDAKRAGKWVAMEGNDEFEPTPFGYDGIPLIPLINRDHLAYTPLEDRRHLVYGGDSDIASVIDIQDRINETILNRMIAQWFASFRQKWATGLNVPDEVVLDSDGAPVLDADGNPKLKSSEPFDVWMDRMIWADSNDVTFGDFNATDIEQYLKSEDKDVQTLSTITRLPRHYLFQEGQSPSGDAIKSAETGLVARVKRKQLALGDPLEEAMRIARLFQGEGEAPPDSEMIWDDPEYQTYGQLVDGVIKEFDAGLVPWEGAMEKLGYSPQQIAKYRGQRNMDQLLRAMTEDEPEGEVAA